MEREMKDRLQQYREASRLGGPNVMWPLYGAGLENLGRDGRPIEAAIPSYGPDELLVRHDACGLCFSDIKVISLGQDHPRIFRDIRKDPVVLGHEVAMTVMGVGQNLAGQYSVGDRFIIQAEIYVHGQGLAYGYMIQGGLSKYAVIDQRILNGDDGNYLLPVRSETGYAESALTEPWACVVAAYQLQYRTKLKPGGVTWMIGRASPAGRSYSLSQGFGADSAPSRLLLTDVPDAFRRSLEARARELGVEVTLVEDIAHPPVERIDDIVLLGADAELIEAVCPHLNDFGILALVEDRPLARPVQVDVGRVHYNRWLIVGSASTDVAAAYADAPVRSTLAPRGRTWFVGAGGPMGRMHLQRAIQVADGPSEIVCTDVSDARLEDLRSSFAEEAARKGIRLVCLNPTRADDYRAAMARHRERGFDDVVVLAPIPAVISEASGYLAPGASMNIFAGVARGTMATLDLTDTYRRSVRIFGHSASSIDDLRLMLHQTEAGILSPNRSVAAIGSLSAARDGLQAVKETRFPGKVVIFPHIREFPLTALTDLKEVLPEVFARLKDGREWTVEAEQVFLRTMLEE
jgi:threonine dehydrogenase-like Zn-dependent dehydrogenase